MRPTPPSMMTRRDYSRIVEQAHDWFPRQRHGQGRVWRRPRPQQGADAGHWVDLLVASLVVLLAGALAWQWWPHPAPPSAPMVRTLPDVFTPEHGPVYVSAGGHGDVPSDSYSCEQAQTITTPRQTIAGGLACLTEPGQTLYIRGGTYREALNLMTTAIPSGRSREQPTRIVGYGQEFPHLHPPTAGTSVITLGPDNVHMAFERLSLHGSVGAYKPGEGMAGRPPPPEHEEVR